MDTTLAEIMPSAMPSETEIAAWNDLPRDEQVRRMRLALADPDRAKSSPHTMDDILALARRRVADGQDG